jgi:hypothetical protein
VVLGEFFAHANGLRTLPGKQECNGIHRNFQWVTAAAG